jgi:Zn-dependent peptidase ImmA (M78 family)
MGRFRVDARINEEADDPDALEREANRFAVKILMPGDVIAARAAELRRDYGCCPRGVLVYRLSAELLVSREAMRYRLADLEVGDD